MKKDKNWTREADKYKNPNATFADKLSNFLYYHKYHLLIGIISVAALIYLSTSILMKEKYDYEIICVLQNPVITEELADIKETLDAEAAPYETKEEEDKAIIYLFKEDTEYICRYLESVGEDLNGDGKVTVSVNYINIEGSRTEVPEIQSHREQVLTSLRTGECMILLGDEVGMEFLSEAEALEDISAYAPNTEFNGHAVLLNPYFSEKIGASDEDTKIYIGLRYFTGTLAQMNNEKKQDFENAKNLLSNILAG